MRASMRFSALIALEFQPLKWCVDVTRWKCDELIKSRFFVRHLILRPQINMEFKVLEFCFGKRFFLEERFKMTSRWFIKKGKNWNCYFENSSIERIKRFEMKQDDEECLKEKKIKENCTDCRGKLSSDGNFWLQIF